MIRWIRLFVSFKFQYCLFLLQLHCSNLDNSLPVTKYHEIQGKRVDVKKALSRTEMANMKGGGGGGGGSHYGGGGREDSRSGGGRGGGGGYGMTYPNYYPPPCTSA